MTSWPSTCEDWRVLVPTSTMSIPIITGESQSLMRLELPLTLFPLGSLATAFPNCSPELLGTQVFSSTHGLGPASPRSLPSPALLAFLASLVRDTSSH